MSWIDWDELMKTHNASSCLTHGGSKSRWRGDWAKQTTVLCVEMCGESKGLSLRGASVIRREKTQPIFQIKHLPGHSEGCGTTLVLRNQGLVFRSMGAGCRCSGFQSWLSCLNQLLVFGKIASPLGDSVSSSEKWE